MVAGVQQLLIVLTIAGLQQLSRMMLHRRAGRAYQRVLRHGDSARSGSGRIAAALYIPA